MLQSIQNFLGYGLSAKNGEIGKAHDILFDDRHMGTRYLVADTGSWLPGRKVLISPESLGSPDYEEQVVPVNLTREVIESSPPLREDEPVSRQFEVSLMEHFAWTGFSGSGAPLHLEEKTRGTDDSSGGNPHLRSTREVSGYKIEATDGEIGKIDDLIVDVETWQIRYLVADIGTWLKGRKVLFSTDWIQGFDFADRKATVHLTKQSIEDSPEFEPALPINRQYEEKLYDYYGRPVYWEKVH